MMHSKRMAPPLSAYFFVLLIASVEALPIVLNADLNPVAQKGIEYREFIAIFQKFTCTVIAQHCLHLALR